jgi:hypothetical protein
MQINPLVFIFACIPLGAQQSVSTVPFSESKDVVRAFSSSGAITLPVARLQIDMTNHATGKKVPWDLTVGYDSATAYYFWRFAPLTSPDQAGGYIQALKSHGGTVYSDATGLYVFEFPNGFWLKIFTSQATSLDAAVEASVNDIRQSPPGHFEGFRPLDLTKAITRDFSFAPTEVRQLTSNEIVSIGKQGSNWQLVLRNRWDEEIILDRNFNLLSARQLTQPEQNSPAHLGSFR